MEMLITPRDINELANSFEAIGKNGWAKGLRVMAISMVERKLPAVTDKEAIGILEKIGISVSTEDLVESIKLIKEHKRETVKEQRVLSNERK